MRHTLKIWTFLALAFFANVNLALANPDPPINIEIYPNPTVDFVTIDLCEFPGEYLNYELVSITGQPVMRGQISELNNWIDLSNLRYGQYILKLNGEQFHTAKVIEKQA